MKTIGDIIKEYRVTHNLSLRDFSKLCDISHSYIDRLEKGTDIRSGAKVEPTMDTITKIAKAMNITIEELLKETGYIEAQKKITNIDYSKNNHSIDSDIIKEQNLTYKNEKDIAKDLEKVKKTIMENQDGLMFDGEPASDEALQSVLDALEFGMKQAKLINKKYIPKKHRK